MAGGTIVRTLPNAHQDFIRSIQCLPNTGNSILSSSYDFKINLFDFNANTNTPSMVFDHGAPVEDISIISKNNIHKLKNYNKLNVLSLLLISLLLLSGSGF